MIGFLLGIASLALRVVSLGMLIYCVMSFVMPQSEIYYKLSAYIQPILNPVRAQLYRWFPSLRSMPLDFSPLAVWLAIDIAEMLIRALGRIF
ncbi:MAG: YggT family protein [Clostridia bacterium]|nr:YggT family protein [Clostridia bacterium]MBR6571792.1 YggT family protein [Clostridia bacterium]